MKRGGDVVLLLALVSVGVLTARAGTAAFAIAAAIVVGSLLPRWFGRRARAAQVESTDVMVTRCIQGLPVAIGIGAVNAKASVVALLGIAFALLPRMRFGSRAGVGWRGIVLVSSLAQAFVLFGREAPLRAITALVVVQVVLAVWQSSIDYRAAFEAVMDSVAFYLIASVFAYYVLGLRSSAAANRISGLASSFSFFDLRVFFPLATSMVTTPVLAATYLCWALPRTALQPIKPKVATLLASGCSVLILLAADYRVPILVLIGCLGFGALQPRGLRTLAIPMAIGVLLLPFWWNGGRNPVRLAVGTTTSQLIPSLERQDVGNDGSTLNNRTHLWEWARAAFDEAPPMKKVLGWGYAGQVKSGAAQGFFAIAHGFSASRTGILAHSTTWQTLLDAGVVGLLLFLTVVCISMRAACGWCKGRSRTEVLSSPLLPLLALVATSGTEVTLAPGVGSETFWIFIALAAVAIRGQRMMNSEDAELRGSSVKGGLVTTGS